VTDRVGGNMEDGDPIETEASEDRLQVGLTEDGRRRIEMLRDELGWFARNSTSRSDPGGSTRSIRAPSGSINKVTDTLAGPCR